MFHAPDLGILLKIADDVRRRSFIWEIPANFTEQNFGLLPQATANGFLLYPDNVLLIETIHQTAISITLNVLGPPEAYADLAGQAVRITGGQAGYSKLYVTATVGLQAAYTAIDRSWRRRHQDAERQPETNSPRPTHYWLTTHWPLPLSSTDIHHRNVYLQEGGELVGREMAPGDKVLIYESATGRTVVERLAGGIDRPIPQHVGRRGIVTVADAAGSFRRRPPAEAVTRYTDGSQKNWAWKATTERHVSNGFTPMADVLRVLGYEPNYTMRGFGQMNSGLREISQTEYEELLRIFVANSQVTAPAPGGQSPPPGRWSEGGGEGPEHRTLKEYIAAHPSIALSEDHVTTFRIEYPFPSGDRADLALRDHAGRFIGVEVEISQNDTQLEGLLQAVKYRHMIAVTEGVTFEECRAVLIAYSLTNGIKDLCRRYDVQPIEIQRESVEAWDAARGNKSG